MATEMTSKFKSGADFFRDSLQGIEDLKDTLKPKREDDSGNKDNDSTPESNESIERNQPSRQDTDDSNTKNV